MKILLLGIFLISQTALAIDALVWGGPGTCIDDCVTSVVHAAKLAGLDPMIVTPENFDASLFETAKIWLQPGGKSATAAQSLGPKNLGIIKKFIAKGGGYVGFCAGAFMATPKVGRTKTPGLGVISGLTKPYDNGPGAVSLEALKTPNGMKFHYWEGGPYFLFNNSQIKKVTITSRYQKTNQINGVQTIYGTGRVAVTGTHPEAPQWWYDDAQIVDIDGLDNEEAASMIKWAAKI